MNKKIDFLNTRYNEKAVINYRGQLIDEGSHKVYLHYGFDGWNNIHTIPMYPQKNGAFKATVPTKNKSEIDFCFKNETEHWDNNDGHDWRIPLK